MAVVESIEFKLTSLDQQADSINKKLTVLIKLLRNDIGNHSKLSETQKGDLTGVPGQPPKPG